MFIQSSFTAWVFFSTGCDPLLIYAQVLVRSLGTPSGIPCVPSTSPYLFIALSGLTRYSEFLSPCFNHLSQESWTCSLENGDYMSKTWHYVLFVLTRLAVCCFSGYLRNRGACLKLYQEGRRSAHIGFLVLSLVLQPLLVQEGTHLGHSWNMWTWTGWIWNVVSSGCGNITLLKDRLAHFLEQINAPYMPRFVWAGTLKDKTGGVGGCA